jgi:geranylgeranyl reductase family protein
MTATEVAVTPPFDPDTEFDALVVGAGPAGSAVAAALALDGHRVVIVDRDDAPGEKPCGELVTPRAVTALRHLGLGDDELDRFHRVTQLRLTTAASSTTTRWPSHDDHPDHAYVAPRPALDELIVGRALAAGATLLRGHEATAPVVDRGFVRGVHVVHGDDAFEIRARFTVVADGANSRFGRALGTYREPSWPFALAHRAVYASGLHDAVEAELVLDLTDRAGTPIAGYGWMFPRGDGTVNVGVLIMSTSPSFRVINPVHLLGALVADHRDRWRLADEPVLPSAGGRIPLGTSVGPAAGPTYVVVGDAAGAANPLSGAGIEYAIETGVLAGSVLTEALRPGGATALQRYPQLLADRYGSYFQVGRLLDRALGRPSVARRVGHLASSHPAFASSFVRLAGNELRSRYPGATELAYRFTRALTLVAPDH